MLLVWSYKGKQAQTLLKLVEYETKDQFTKQQNVTTSFRRITQIIGDAVLFTHNSQYAGKASN